MSIGRSERILLLCRPDRGRPAGLALSLGTAERGRSVDQPAGTVCEKAAGGGRLCRRMPIHPAFGGLTIEIASDEAIHDRDFLAEIAREMTLHNIGLSIDNLGANWPELMGLRIPFIELKADRQFVAG
ncbi:hypothetical protein [Bradyrhizobium nanningense]|uniref:hypothetical protein n=1 Tax=Bradyrhizobium nanningense TaxID=1325118 RepID=UPI001FDFE248|nr:hypothetical protein [Bradyrhizobium nanningense]